MKTKLIIFDLDGTLLYTLEDLKNSINYSLKKNNLKERNINEIQNFVGNGIEKLVIKSVGIDDKELIKNCTNTFLKHYTNNSNIYSKPYDGAIDFLKKIKKNDIKLAILSNKIDSEVKKLSDIYFKNIFNISQGATEIFGTKPNKGAVEYIINLFNVKKEETIFIGDSDVDIKTAKNAQIKSISVSWGYKSQEFLKENGANIIVNSFEELYEKILSL